MYYQTVQQFIRTLKNLDAILEKAIAHAAKHKFDVNNFCGARLFPDMLPFTSQIRIACDHAKNLAANLSGREAPRHEDNETTMEELRGRIGKCLAYLQTFSAADFARTTSENVVKLTNPAGKTLLADEYVFMRQIPNFYFHTSIAYALLRKGGVEIGKGDFIGQLPVRDPA
ncbi:MAG TPA: DUF1993 domain-containing protein [Polyangia bacterium]